MIEKFERTCGPSVRFTRQDNHYIRRFRIIDHQDFACIERKEKEP